MQAAILALFSETAIAYRKRPSQTERAYYAGLLTAIQALGLQDAYIAWCGSKGYKHILDTMISVTQEL